MNARGEYGARALHPGRGHYYGARRDGGTALGAWYGHTIEERAEAVRSMAVDWTALFQNLASQAGELTADPKEPGGYRLATQADWDAHPPDPAKREWWLSYARPLIKQWSRFKNEQLGGLYTTGDAYIAWTERATTSWGTYEDWKKKLDALRADAQKRGFSVTTSTPMPLPSSAPVWEKAANVIERGASDIWSGAGDVWSLVKYGAWAVLGIGAVVALSSVASRLRSGRDPAEPYVALVRRRGARELPSSPRLALPPGEPAMEVA